LRGSRLEQLLFCLQIECSLCAQNDFEPSGKEVSNRSASVPKCEIGAGKQPQQQQQASGAAMCCSTAAKRVGDAACEAASRKRAA